MTENQATLYYCLQQIHGAVTSLSRIARATGISEHTLKSCLKKLRQAALIHYDGRRNCGGRVGFTATTLPGRIVLQGNKNRLLSKLQQIDYQALGFTTSLEGMDTPSPPPRADDHPMDHPMDHLMAMASCSSSKEQLLQGLLLDGMFANLNPRSLLPYLEQFETTEALQNFLDIANACGAAAQEGRGKPIHNPHGFLIAQLHAGYVNPPQGYKSRKVRAQEFQNQQLEEELATLRRLQEREQELRYELFVAQLTTADLDRLVHEAQARVTPNLGLSAPFQLKIHKEALLKEWFAQRQPLPQEDRGDL